MAVLSVNPTRMVLNELKRKLDTARRGHKLLKDKRDELMRQFLELVRENKRLRIEVEAAVKEATRHMAVAGSVTDKAVLDTALLCPKQEVELDIREKSVMSVPIPRYTTHFKTADTTDVFSYGYAFTSEDMDDAIASLAGVFPELIRLAEVEKSCQLLASEIEKTRRRVNALEYVMIPDYEDTIKYITMKLDESERSTTTRLMKVKDMMVEQTRRARAAKATPADS